MINFGVLEAIHLRLTDLFRNADKERSIRSRFLNDLCLVYSVCFNVWTCTSCIDLTYFICDTYATSLRKHLGKR